jgi:acetyl-CoA carboxylase carboxyltransferase component
MNESLVAPMQGTVLWVADVGQVIGVRRPIVIIESMKMQHDVVHDSAAQLIDVLVEVGATVKAGDHLVTVQRVDEGAAVDDPDEVDVMSRPDLDEVQARHRLGLDESRPSEVDRRRSRGRRTARENLHDLVDEGTFVEYGPLAVAAQRRRRSLDELIARTPADGLIGGIAEIDDERVVVMSYDYTVLAGTQGQQNHRKKDRLFDVAERLRLPVVLFAEGGGGRPGDTDGLGVSGLDCWAFHDFARLSGLVPLVGIAGGFCFAGNAALLGCCDVVIALEGSNIGMGGPAMIEGGGLGVFPPDAIGPVSVQASNGVVDLVARDDAHSVALAKRYLGYFRNDRQEWTAPPQDELRRVVPTDRKKAYDMREVLHGVFDVDSVLELRSGFGLGMITALARIEGRPVGVIANDPRYLAGAIDSDGADKAARFMQLCDAFDIPLVTLVDTPGMMVGPEVEETALVRHCSRLFVTGVNLDVPVVSVVIRKSYGLGAQAMMAGSTKAPLACVAWPTGEFGGMGLEGAVRLGYRNELAAIVDPSERETAFQAMVDRMYEHGKALSVATHFEIDDVIDPVDTRRWIRSVVGSWNPERRVGRKRPNVDTW